MNSLKELMKLLGLWEKKTSLEARSFFRTPLLCLEKEIDKERQQPGEVINLLMKVLLELIAEKLHLKCH